MTFYTYIIKSDKNGTFYYGQTTNLLRRLNQHNKGLREETRSARPWVLIAYKEFGTRSGAMSYERRLRELKTKNSVMNFIKTHGFKRV